MCEYDVHIYTVRSGSGRVWCLARAPDAAAQPAARTPPSSLGLYGLKALVDPRYGECARGCVVYRGRAKAPRASAAACRPAGHRVEGAIQREGVPPASSKHHACAPQSLMLQVASQRRLRPMSLHRSILAPPLFDHLLLPTLRGRGVSACPHQDGELGSHDEDGHVDVMAEEVHADSGRRRDGDEPECRKGQLTDSLSDWRGSRSGAEPLLGECACAVRILPGRRLLQFRRACGSRFRCGGDGCVGGEDRCNGAAATRRGSWVCALCVGA